MARLFVGQAAGEVSQDALAGATTLNSEAFELLPVVADPDFIDITVDCDGILGAPVTVRVTGHTEGATSVTTEPLLRSFKKGMDWAAGLTEEFVQELAGTAGDGGGSGTGTGSISSVLIARDTGSGWSVSPQTYIDAADYICDGVDDQEQFAAAVADAQAAGHRQLEIYLAPGTYVFSNSVSLAANTGLDLVKIYRPTSDWIYWDSPMTWDTYLDNVGWNGPFFTNIRYLEIDGVSIDAGDAGWLADLGTSYACVTLRRAELGQYTSTAPPMLQGNFDLIVENACFYANNSLNPMFLCTNKWPSGRVLHSYIDINPSEPEGQGGFIRFEPPRITWNDTNYWNAFTFENNLINRTKQPVITTEGFFSQLRVAGNWAPISGVSAPYSFELNDSSLVDVADNHFMVGGVRASGCRDISIKDNVFMECDEHAVALVDTVKAEVTGNRIIDPGVQIPLTHSGIFLDGTSSENLVADNRVLLRDLDPDGATPTGPLHGIRINAATCEDNRIRDNWLHNGLDISDAGTRTVSGGIVDLTSNYVALGYDAAGTSDYTASLASISPSGSYLQSVDTASWLNLASSGDIVLGGSVLKLLNESVTGVDGTATPSTVAELADVLVDLGIIAGHTIT